MNFFERQDGARRASRRLLWLFALAVLAIVLAVTAAATVAMAAADPAQIVKAGGLRPWMLGHSGAMLGIALLTAGVVAAASAWRVVSLRQGGAQVARQQGGREIAADCRAPQERRLRNVVEEIAIAACVPVPAVFVLDDEPGINAFAAGYSPSDAAIAVTRGALERLNRDELQGVVAHEFSHILNGDMRLNIQLIGLLFGIQMIGLAGRKLLESGRYGGSRNASAVLLAGAVLAVIGYTGVFFARLIKAGVSRSREVLADASAVQFTRQSSGLAGALKKIAGLADGSTLGHARAEEVSHMLFGEWRSYSSWFATHPPLLDRIGALEPGFNPAQWAKKTQDWAQQPPDGMNEDRLLGLDGAAALQLPGSAVPAAGSELRPYPGTTASRIALPVADDVQRASGLHQALPVALIDAARDGQGARALVLALLVDRDRAVQARQLAEVAVEIDDDVADAVAERLPDCQALHPSLRLPLVALTFPALRRLPRSDLQQLVRCADRLVHLDGKVGLFDYCLSRMLQRQVIEALDPSRYRPAGKRKLADCAQSLADLFATVVSYGHDDPDAMRRAYVAGLIAVSPNQRFEFAPPKAWIAAMDRSLAELDGLDPTGKQLLVEGLVIAIGHDGRISVAEAELLRTICACLHCPLPPVVEQRARPR